MAFAGIITSWEYICLVLLFLTSFADPPLLYSQTFLSLTIYVSSKNAQCNCIKFLLLYCWCITKDNSQNKNKIAWCRLRAEHRMCLQCKLCSLWCYWHLWPWPALHVPKYASTWVAWAGSLLSPVLTIICILHENLYAAYFQYSSCRITKGGQYCTRTDLKRHNGSL